MTELGTPGGRALPGRGWVVAGLIVGMLGMIIAAPLALDAALPDLPQDRVGVYERVRLVEPAAAGTAVAGFLAPAGWVWASGRTSGLFTTADGLDAIRAELHPDVSDGDGLIRAGVPVGAVALPVAESVAPSGLAVTTLEYDLAAGDNPAISVLACTRVAPVDCLLLLGTFSAGDEEDRDRAERALLRMLASAEVAR